MGFNLGFKGLNLIFLNPFFFNTQISKLMKICPVRAEFFHADRRVDGWRDMTKLVITFHNFANAPKNCDIKIVL